MPLSKTMTRDHLSVAICDRSLFVMASRTSATTLLSGLADLLAKCDERIERSAALIEEMERGIDSLVFERDEARKEAHYWRTRVDE